MIVSFIMLCKCSMSSTTSAANVDKMSTSVPTLQCRVLYTFTHYMAAKCSEMYEILFGIYTGNE